MATIPLRDYCREIENMIEKGHTDEAIAHCRHILKHFPKHIETYRLLGKSYLESRQLGDAADIFQRVLSSIPEDFVSHIGMSIIREDEGNLDAAIWHMERAFEVQSSNMAIQDELRRLYGNRDGQEPPKIRLTRGALAHMYANGNLYSQAIGELRAALATDPKRLDLQGLLAKMYYEDKQSANAAKTASQLITKLPYCLVANQILAEILSNSQRKSEAAPHRSRVQELDPYYKHVSAQYPTLEVVPPGVIVIETLDWEATKGGLISQPAWATSIGVDISNTPAGEELPEWLSPSAEQRTHDAAFGEISLDDDLKAFASPSEEHASEGDAQQTTEQFSKPSQIEETIMEEDDNIPDWMKDAGWEERDPNTPEEPPAPLFDDEGEENLASGEIAKASIPDWLKAMAPKDEEGDDESSSAPDLPEWLQSSSTGETAPSRITQTSRSETPDWMLNSDEPATQDSDTDLPDWLGDEASPGDSDAATPLAAADMPDWLKDLSGPTPSAPGLSVDDLEDSTAPEWLQEISDEVRRSTGPLDEKVVASDWLSEESEETVTDSDAKALEDLFAKSGDEETAPAGASWLDEFEEAEEDPSLRSGVTDWLSSMTSEEEEVVPSAAEVPDWLQELGQEEPDDAGNLFAIEDEPETASEEMPPSFEVEELGKDALPNLELEEDAMAWLESLAAKQGAKAEELLTKPEDREETSLPSWLQEIADETPEEEIPEGEEMVPEWLRSVEEEPAAAELAQEAEEAFDLVPEEPLALEEEPAPVEDFELPTAVESPAEGVLDLESDDETMAWLEGLAAKQGAKEEEMLISPAERSEEIPEWLQGILGEETADEAFEPDEIGTPIQETDLSDLFEDEEIFEIEAPQTEAVAGFEMESDFTGDEEEAPELAEAETNGGIDEDAALAWLESLAAKQGVSEEELLTTAEDRPEETPAWVQEAADVAQAEEPVFEEEFPGGLSMEEEAEEEILWPEEVETEQPAAEAPLDEEMDTSWISDLLEEEEPSAPVPEDVPDWLTESAASFIAGAAESSSISETDAEETVISEYMEEPPAPEAEEEVLPEVEAVEVEPEAPSWMLEEEAAPVSEMETPEEEVEVEEVPVPEMEIEAEPEPAAEPIALEEGEVLSQARATLAGGDVTAAAEYYEKLVKRNQNIDEIIADITEALDTRYPVDIGLWQTLGDAYVRKNKLQDALNSYTKAEELLR